MAKKTVATATDKNGIPMPDPTPKVGDTVEFNWPSGTERADLTGRSLAANVTAVYDGFDGRLVDLDVDSGKGPIPVKSAPWRDEQDNTGNSWHWPS
jgi:hypothetical protein